MTDLLVRGDPRLHRICKPITWPDAELTTILRRLHGELADFRRRHGFGRAIAAPQIGIDKRMIAMNLGATPFALLNPEITWRSDDTFELWDDCLSVPDHVVRVRRHCSISLRYRDEHGRQRTWEHLPPELSELVQHEVDHLNGMLMTERAVDADSIRPIGERSELPPNSRTRHRLSLPAITEAASVIDPVFRNTPQFDCESLSEALGCKLTLKLETANPIRSFKGRGADFFLHRTDQSERKRPMVCASAGNFGQALAYACRGRGRDLIVYAATSANPLKVERMRALGAEVRLQGGDFDAAKAAARDYSLASGAYMVEDGLEPAISEGAGTIAVELSSRHDAFDTVVVPVGNGALISGIGRWFKAASPATRVVGVCALGADAMEKSWRQKTMLQRQTVSTIADGIAVRVPIEEALADMEGVVDDIVLVDDEATIESMRLLYRHAGFIVEPAGATGVAAILAAPRKFRNQQVATVICGSNIEDDRVREWIVGG